MSRIAIFKHGLTTPTEDILEYGEIAICYQSGDESISIKNSDNEITTISLETIKGATEHTEDMNNPHEVTAEQLNLENVQNHSDENLEISTAMQEILDLKLNISDVYSDSFYETSDDGTLTLRNDVDEDTYEKLALAASYGDTLSSVISSFLSGSTDDLEARICALENVLTKEGCLTDSDNSDE